MKAAEFCKFVLEAVKEVLAGEVVEVLSGSGFRPRPAGAGNFFLCGAKERSYQERKAPGLAFYDGLRFIRLWLTLCDSIVDHDSCSGSAPSAICTV